MPYDDSGGVITLGTTTLAPATNFAPSADTLATSGTNAVSSVVVTSSATAGQGVSLTATGAIPASTVNDYLPWLIDIDVFPTATSQINWDTLGAPNSSDLYNARKDSTGVQNAEINWAVTLSAGTWTFELIYIKRADGGIFSIQVNGVEQGVIDSYSAVASANNRTSITGIVIPVAGKYTLTIRMATKNASSSNFQGSIHAVQFRRTA